MVKDLIISRLVLEQAIELKRFLEAISVLCDPGSSNLCFTTLGEHYKELSFPNPYNPRDFINLIIDASKKNRNLFPDFLKLLQSNAAGQDAFEAFIKLHNSFVCLQELEDELELLRETKIRIDKQEYDAYLFVELNLTNTYKTLFPDPKTTKPEFMELLNEFGSASPDEDSQPLITFIKQIEDIFTRVGKEGLKEKTWQITKRFLALRHEIGDKEIQRYQNQYDRKRQSEEVQDRNSSSETVRDAVLFSVRRKVALKTIRYYVTAHQWDGTFHPPVELKKELKKNELEKSITAYLSELAQNSQISTKAVVEFFLPNELINLSVDQWKIEEDEGTPQTLGVLYCVLIRCQKRLMGNRGKGNGRIQARVQERWHDLHASFSEKEARKIGWIDPNEPELVDLLVSSEYHCTGFTTVIHADKIKSLEALSTSAIPIALWTREQIQLPADSNDLYQDRLRLFFEKRLKTSTMSNINELMRAVLRLRQRSDSGEVRKHISLFWDDPGRYIPHSEAQFP